MSDPLLDAFWAYEQALVGNDVAALSAWFTDTPTAIRTDPTGLLSGNADIAEFRRNRPAPADRIVERLHLRWISDETAVLVAETRSVLGTRSTQLQVWQRGDAGWRILVAQVAPGQPSVVQPVADTDDTVWRLRAEPLPGAAGHGDLDGLRVAVKDLYAVAGQRIGAGNPTWLAGAPIEEVSAPAVTALTTAGAVVAGIVQTDELAFSLAGLNAHYGTPPNPACPDRIPGGSSSGCAAAVAGGAADIGLGTDTAGSIRVPASYCGLYGLRLTHGVLGEGLVNLAPSYDAVGLLTREAATLRRACAALTDATSDTIRRVVVVDELVALAEEPIQQSFHAALLALVGRRCLDLVAIDGFGHGQLDTWFEAFRTTQAAEAWKQHGRWITEHPGALHPTVLARFEIGRAVTAAQRAAAALVIETARAELVAMIPPGTALLLPAASSAAPLLTSDAATIDAARAATLRLTCLASLAGLPALSAPLLARGPLPVGLGAIGSSGAELSLIDLVAP